MKKSTNLKIETLDFSKKETFESYLSLFKSNDLKQSHPNFFKILEKTKQQHENNGGCNYKSLLQINSNETVDAQSPWVDGAYVNWLYRDTQANKLKGQVTVSLTSIQPCIMVMVTLRKNNITRQCTGNKDQTSQFIYSFECDDFDDSVNVEDIEIDINCSHINNSMLLTSQNIKSVYFVDLDAYSPVNKIAVVDPENIKTNFGDPVTIAYGRGVVSGDPVDYDYQSNYKNIKFPFNGYVFLEEGTEYFDCQSTRLILDCTQGTTQYLGHTTNVFNKFDLGFSWKFDEDWQQPIDYSTIPAGTLISLSMILDYTYTKAGQHSLDTIFISSTKEDEFTSHKAYQQIPKLKFLWGCLGKDTLVLMADGKERKISEINAKDIIRNHKGEQKIVSQVLKGYEKNIIHISTKEAGTILASEQHPFITNKGNVAANFLTNQHQLLLSNGNFAEIIEAYEVKYDDYVYNITLRDEINTKTDDITQTFIANSYVVGDNAEQNKLISEEKEKVVLLSSELMNEISNLF